MKSTLSTQRSPLGTQYSALSTERRRRRLGYVQNGLALLLIAAVLVFLPGVMSRRDEAMELAAAAEDADLRAAADRAVWRAWLNARELERGYQLCPPADPAAPSVMVIVVENRSDKHPLFKTCFRVPEHS